MSSLVHYTLKSDDHHDAQKTAMTALIHGLKSERIAGFHYSCFATNDQKRFVGLMEFPDDATKRRFLDSETFATYSEAVGPTLENSPETTEITAFASTRH